MNGDGEKIAICIAMFVWILMAFDALGRL